MSPIIVALNCWGKHIDLFRRLGFPSLLAEGNLDWLRRFGPVHIVIFSPERDAPEIRSIIEPHARPFASARCMAFPDALLTQHPAHTILCAMQRQAVGMALGQNAGLSWLFPDCHYAAGSFASLGDLDEARKNGIGAFVSQGGSVVGDSTLYLDGALPRLTPDAASLLPREALIEALHPATKGGFVKGYGVENGPSTRSPWLTWWESSPGYVGHTFAPNPVLCWPREQTRLWVAAMDGDFLDAWSMHGIVEPAHAFTWLEARINDDGDPLDAPAMTEEEIAQWAAREATPVGIRFFREQLTPWHSAPNPEAAAFAKRVSERALDIRADLGWRTDGAAYAPRLVA